MLLWQCITGQFPFGKKTEVAQDSPEAVEIRERLSRGERAGVLKELKEVPELKELIDDCWRQDPMSRPTASLIALKLIGLSARLAGQTTNSTSELHTSMTSINDSDKQLHDEFQRVRQTSLNIICEARKLNVNAVELVQLERKIDASDFDKLLEEEDGTDALTSFIVGAAYWWNVCHASRDQPDDTFIPSLTLSTNGKPPSNATFCESRSAKPW